MLLTFREGELLCCPRSSESRLLGVWPSFHNRDSLRAHRFLLLWVTTSNGQHTGSRTYFCKDLLIYLKTAC